MVAFRGRIDGWWNDLVSKITTGEWFSVRFPESWSSTSLAKKAVLRHCIGDLCPWQSLRSYRGAPVCLYSLLSTSSFVFFPPYKIGGSDHFLALGSAAKPCSPGD